MTTSPSKAKLEALSRVAANANGAWVKAARNAVHTLATRQRFFTTDDVWEQLRGTSATTHEPRALGAVMRSVSKARIVKKTGRVVASTRSVNHGREIPVWESCVFRENGR